MRARLIARLLRLFAALPWRWNRALGTGLGWMLAHTPNPVWRHSAINLRLCLPEQSPDDHRRLLRTSLIETGKTVLEAGPLWFWPAERIRGLMGEAVNVEPVDAAIRSVAQGELIERFVKLEDFRERLRSIVASSPNARISDASTA